MTYMARLKAIADALLNATATLQQLNRLARACAAEVGRLDEYTVASDAIKAKIAIESIRAHMIGLVRSFEGREAAEAAGAIVDQDLKDNP